MIEAFDTPEDKITVTYLGFDDFSSFLNDSENKKYVSREDYLLFVGSRSGHKNFSGFIKAVSESRRLKNDFGIICFGGGAFSR